MKANRAQIEFLARSTRNSLIVLHIIYVVKFRYGARFTRTHEQIINSCKVQGENKGTSRQTKKKGEKKCVNEGGNVCYNSSLLASHFFLWLLFTFLSENNSRSFVRKFELDHNNDRKERERERWRPYRMWIDPFVVFFLDYIVFTISWFFLCAHSTRLSGAVRLTLNTSNWWDSTPPLLCSRSYRLFLVLLMIIMMIIEMILYAEVSCSSLVRISMASLFDTKSRTIYVYGLNYLDWSSYLE